MVRLFGKGDGGDGDRLRSLDTEESGCLFSMQPLFSGRFGQPITGFTHETIAAALHAAGIRTLGHSPHLHRPRGLFCAIGNCSSCFMTVDGEPNVRVCVTRVKAGMKVEEQHGKGVVL